MTVKMHTKRKLRGPAVEPDGEKLPVEDKPSRKAKDLFYGKGFTLQETEDLDAGSHEKLDDEIAMLRVAIRRCFEAASSLEPADLEGWTKALSSLGVASTRLASLLSSQKQFGAQGGDSTLALLSAALTSVRKEMGI